MKGDFVLEDRVIEALATAYLLQPASLRAQVTFEMYLNWRSAIDRHKTDSADDLDRMVQNNIVSGYVAQAARERYMKAAAKNIRTNISLIKADSRFTIT